MTYESFAAACQMVAMTLFGAIMLGVIVHVMRPANKVRFDMAARLPLGHDEGTGEQSHGSR